MKKKLKQILAKSARGEELTAAEKKFLAEHSDQLTASQRKELGVTKDEQSEDDAAGSDADGEQGDSDESGDDDADDADADAGDADESDADDDDEDETAEVEADEEVQRMIGKIVAKEVRKGLRGVEKTVTKQLGKAPAIKTGQTDIEKLSPEVRTVRHFKAYIEKDYGKLKDFNQHSLEVMKSWDADARAKAGYANEGTAADGGNLVPPADFVAEVQRLEPQYGVARQDANTYSVRSNSVILPKKSGFGLQLYATNEGAAKTGVKMGFDKDTITLAKYAGIAPVTDELDDDSAIDIFRELTTDFARAKAFKEDQLVFTDSTSGIIHQAGLAKALSIGTDISGLTFDELVTAIYAAPSQVINSPRAKWYMHRGFMAAVMNLKDSQNRPIYQPDLTKGGAGTVLGYPVVLTEVLSGVGSVGQGTFVDGNNTAFAVFGDLQYTTLIDKGGLDLTLLTEGTVHGSDNSAINLAEQDMKALRAVTRVANKVRQPGAFVVVGSGSVS